MVQEGLESPLPLHFEKSLLFGFALMHSWTANVAPQTPMEALLLGHLQRMHGRSDNLIVQHNVLQAGLLECPLPFECESVSGNRAWSLCSERPMSLKCLSCGLRSSVPGSTSFGKPEASSVLCVRVHHLVAFALASGELRADFSAIPRRKRKEVFKDHVLFPALPDATTVSRLRQQNKKLLDLSKLEFLDSPENLPKVATPMRHHHGKNALVPCRWDKNILSQAVFVTSNMKNIRKAGKTVTSVSGYASMFTGKPQDDLVLPSPTLLNVARVQVDIAAMLAYRHLYKINGPYYRFVAFDMSPQARQSFEVLNTCEITVNRQALHGIAFEDIDPAAICRRKLPIVCIAQGFADAASRTWARLHQDWCEYGSSKDCLRNALDDCYQCFTDMGCELLVNDYHDITDSFLDTLTLVEKAAPSTGMIVASKPASDPTRTGYLFKNSMRVCGPLHCIDWIIRSAMAKVPFFPVFLKRAKLIVQFFHSHRRRVFMGELAKSLGFANTDLDAITTALANATGRFASWRWGSLVQVLDDLINLEKPLRLMTQDDTVIKQWPVKMSTATRKALVYGGSSAFWGEISCCKYLIEPLWGLHCWFKGCHCHTSEYLKAHPNFHCPFQGMRAKWAATKVQETITHYRSLQQSLHSQAFVAENNPANIDGPRIFHVLGHIAASLNLKLLQWMEDLPYLLWQVLGRLCITCFFAQI